MEDNSVDNQLDAQNQKPGKNQDKLVTELKEAVSLLTSLAGLITICASCKRIRSQQHDWLFVEDAILKHIDVLFSHDLCPDCIEKLYPSYAIPAITKGTLSSTHSANATILVVDDEPDLVENIQMALETQGYEIVVANSGFEALAILQSHKINLVLSDVSMPAMDGYELHEQMSHNPLWRSIPFILLTSYAHDTLIRFDNAPSPDVYLAKPVRSADLLAIVNNLLQSA